MALRKWPESLSRAEECEIFANQTEIMKWLRSLGHRTLEDADHETRSCRMKRRFENATAALDLEPTLHVYRCRYCAGWHLTTPRSDNGE